MKLLLSAYFIFFFTISISAQNSTKDEIELAFNNAQKGIFYALSNIPENKTRMNQELIEKNKLLAKVKLNKEINGVKIEATGYYLSNEVSITIYKSFDSLVKEGYIKNGKSK